jgi:hypothetical protein
MSSYHRTGAIDRRTAERMLDRARAGRPAGGDPLVDLLALAAAPAGRDELAGESAALAAFRAARLAPANRPRRQSMIKTTLAKALTLKAAAVLAATAAGGVALAASTGALPNPLSETTQHAPSAAGHVSGRPSVAGSHRGGPDGSDASPSPSLVGLCHAYLAGAGSDHGKALENPAFSVLITTAGGKDKVDAFCTALLASAGPSKDAKDHPTGASTPHPTGAPESRGNDGQLNHPTGAPASRPGH